MELRRLWVAAALGALASSACGGPRGGTLGEACDDRAQPCETLFVCWQGRCTYADLAVPDAGAGGSGGGSAGGSAGGSGGGIAGGSGGGIAGGSGGGIAGGSGGGIAGGSGGGIAGGSGGGIAGGSGGGIAGGSGGGVAGGSGGGTAGGSGGGAGGGTGGAGGGAGGSGGGSAQTLTFAGTCSFVDQPGWLSCPTGMSCQCYYNWYTLFTNQPSQLNAQLTASSLAISGGTLPSNTTLYPLPAATVALSGAPPSGATWPYTVTTSATGTITVTVWATAGYVAPRSVLYSSADCGNEGQQLTCTFVSP